MSGGDSMIVLFTNYDNNNIPLIENNSSEQGHQNKKCHDGILQRSHHHWLLYLPVLRVSPFPHPNWTRSPHWMEQKGRQESPRAARGTVELRKKPAPKRIALAKIAKRAAQAGAGVRRVCLNGGTAGREVRKPPSVGRKGRQQTSTRMEGAHNKEFSYDLSGWR